MPRAKDDTKIKAIHEAARSLVLRTGFSGLKMADVAKEAGIATGTLYVYYESKEVLINEAFGQTKDRMAAALASATIVEGNYYQSFRNLWMAYVRYCYTHPAEMLFVDQMLYSGYLSSEAIAKAEASTQPVYDFIDWGKNTGVIRDAPTELLTAHLMGAIHEVIKYAVARDVMLTQPLLDICCTMAWNSLRQ